MALNCAIIFVRENFVMVVFLYKGKEMLWRRLLFCILKEEFKLNDAEFQVILNQLSQYLAMEKNFIVNPIRETEFKKAIKLACELFPDAKVYIQNDALEMGAMILRVESFDINISDEREIKLFSELISIADNFEVYAIEDNNIRFAAVFQNVLVRI